MAKPKVFISSTYYDLRHVRTALEGFIVSLGYEPILSEKGHIAYAPDRPLDESCYEEVKRVNIYLLIIGGRYGTEASSKQNSKSSDREFYSRYDSITKKEYLTAVSSNIPIYILIDVNVYAEYQTFLKNKSRKNFDYAHVDSVNIFHLIEEILQQKKNNPVQAFANIDEITKWLKEQWAGLFADLIGRINKI